MPAEQFANNAQSTLAAAIASGDATLTVASAAAFPSAPQFRILVDQELMLVTTVNVNQFAVTRGIEGTTAAAHAQNTYVTHILTAAALLNLLPADLVYTDQANALTKANTFTGPSGGSATAVTITTGATSNVALLVQATSLFQTADIVNVKYKSSVLTTSTALRITSAGAALFQSSTGASFTVIDSVGGGLSVAAVFSHTLNGGIGATNGVGGIVRFTCDDNGAFQQQLFDVNFYWTNATDASRTSQLDFVAYDSGGSRVTMSLGANGAAPLVGFYGVAPVVRQLLATGAGHTVDDVITALQALGLVRQS